MARAIALGLAFVLLSRHALGIVVAEKKFNVLKMELLRGDVDPATGRGAIGGADQVLHPVGEDPLPVSDPAPRVVLENLSASNVSQNASKRLVADIQVSGYVTFALADVVPSNEADPTTATLVVAEREAGTMTLQRVAEDTSLLRPYAAKFSFSGSFSSVPVVSYDVPVVVKVEDPAIGNVGFDMATFTVLASRNKSVPGDGSTTDFFSGLIDEGLSQPLKLRVDLGSHSTLEEIAAAGPDAVSVLTKRSYEAGETPLSVTAGLELVDGQNPVISSDGQVTIEMTDTTSLGLETNVLGAFEASVSVPGLYSETHTVTFEETAADSNVFCSKYVEVSLTFGAALDSEAKDTVSAQARKTLWDDVGAWESAQLQEDDNDSKVFGSGDFVVSIVRMSGMLPWRYDEIAVSVSNAALSIAGHPADASETGADSKVFESGRVLLALPVANEYGDAWIKGPWEVTQIAHQDGSDPGPYIPLMVRVESATDLVAAGVKCELFGIEHDLIEHNGQVFCAGSSKPGVYATTGNLKVGETFGAGHVSKTEGFVWATLKGAAVGGAVKSHQVIVHNTARALYDELKTLADDRRAKRFGATPGASYFPTYDAANDPRDAFIDLLWNDYFEQAKVDLGKAVVDDEVRRRALALMNRNDPTEAVLGIPHTPNHVFANALNIRHVYGTGNQYLIGHWEATAGTVHDFDSQRQNVTDIIHWNTGLGWGILKPRLDSLIAILEASYASSDERAQAIMNWLRTNGYLDTLTAAEQAQLAKYGDVKGFDYKVRDRHAWKELIDIATMARAFGGASIDALDLFMAYDIASGEAFHVFGIDPFNDVIATEAGARFGAELAAPGSSVASKATLKLRLETHFRDARLAFLQHPLNSNRGKMLSAFFSVMMATDGTSFVPVRIQHGSTQYTIWEATLGTIVHANRTKLGTAKSRQDFVDKVIETLRDQSKTSLSDPKAALSTTDVRALHQIIEMLSLANQPR